MHEDWPRKLLESSSCGDGFWESDGKGHYANKGIMLEVSVGQPVCVERKYNESAHTFV